MRPTVFLLALTPLTTALLLANVSSGGALQPEKPAARIEIIQSIKLPRWPSRPVRVYLPPDYDAGRARPYPVLYMLDGQDLFGAAGGWRDSEGWYMDEIATALIRDGKIEPLVIVGIDSLKGSRRANEYLPWTDYAVSQPIRKPLGRHFYKFLSNAVISVIEARYNVGTDPSERGLGGSSYGGLQTFHMATDDPGHFGFYLVESPSLNASSARTLDRLDRVDSLDSRIYIGTGTHEGETSCKSRRNKIAVKNVERAARQLTKILRDPGDLLVHIEDCGFHMTYFWARRLTISLPHLVPPDREK